MKTVNLKFSTEPKASRIELLVRLVYWIPLVIVSVVLGILSAICWFITLLTVLILGKRFVSLTNLMAISLIYQTKFSAYYSFLTDERPEIIPENLS